MIKEEPIWYKYRCITDELTWCNKGDIVSAAFRDNIFEDRITKIKYDKIYQWQSPQILFFNNFILLAKWREEQIDNILND